MKFCLSVFMVALLAISACAARDEQVPNELQARKQITALLEMQSKAWNKGDIDEFVTGYWNSDQTIFVGANGVNRGFQSVTDRYHREYPNQKLMGHLTFSNLEIHLSCKDAAYVIGEYKLDREQDHPSGFFTLYLKKFPQGWRIILDHSTKRAS